MTTKDDGETLQQLVQRWRERAAELEQADWSAAYHLRFAADELDGIIKRAAAAMLVDAFAEPDAGDGSFT